MTYAMSTDTTDAASLPSAETPATETPKPEAAPAAPAPAAAPAAAESAPAAAESAPAAAESSTDAGDDDGDDAEGAPAEGGAAATAEGGEPKKKRRRRRKKKKPASVEGEAKAEGPEGEAKAEGSAKPEGGKPEGERPRREKKEREEREPPPFKLGDVVFGKVTDVTEDVLVIDLSGKAKALFDLRELLLPEDEEGPDDDKDDDHDHEHDHEGTAEAQPEGDHAATAAVAEAVSAVAEAMTEAVAQAVADAVISAAGVPEEAPAAPPTAESAPAPAEAAPAAAAEAPAPDAAPKEPKLPRVILEPGAPFVGVVHNDGARGGYVVLTHHPKRVKRAKPVVAAAFRDKTLVWGIVTGVIKGGVEVDVEGLRAFAPASHMDLRMGASLQPLVGKRLAFAVTTYAKRGRDVVLSRRAMLEADAKAHREEALAKLEMNAVVDGVVRTVVQFGAFVDVGGVEGLVPLSEMSHNRADQPKDVFKVGETVKVKILRVDEKGKLWLSRRQATPDPWGEVAQKYAMGTRHTGKIVRIQPFGAFVELESGIDGLIHTADLSYKRIEKPEDVVKVGDELEVVVAHLDAGHHRIGLHPALTGDQANEQPQKVAPHKMVKCVVVQIDPNGLQVRILGATGRHARAFITAAATGTPRGTDLRKSFPVGKEMDAKVLEIDPRRGEVKLSVKAFNEENERSAYQQYRAQVKREAKFGTLADLLQKSLKKDG